MPPGRFIAVMIVIVLLGINVAGSGINSVVGEGPWQVLAFRYDTGTLALSFCGKTIDLQLSSESLEKSLNYYSKFRYEIKNYWHRGVLAVRALLEDAQNRIAGFNGE